MTDYTITTNFGAKDSLPSGNAGKVIKGEEFTTEFTNIATAVNTKADTAGDTFTGVVNFSDDVAVNTNTLFVDASTAKVGIGTTTPSAVLDVTAGNIVAGGKAIEISGNTSYIADGSYGTSLDITHNYQSNDGSFRAINIDLTDTGTNNQSLYGLYVNAEYNYLSGNVGIGATSPSTTLDVHSSTNGHGLYIAQDNAGDGYHTRLTFQGSNGSGGFNTIAGLKAYQEANGTNGYLRFDTNGDTERMRIDSSGNVLVGRTSDSFTVQGLTLRNSPTANSSIATFTRDGSNVAAFNRLTNDGSLVTFYKDGITVGSIGTYGANGIVIGNGDTQLALDSNIDAIFPAQGSGLTRDNAIDLGRTNARFKDIYASGTVTANSFVSTATAGDVGTYAALLYYNNGTPQDVNFGTTKAGSLLRQANFYRFGYNNTAVSGTWRCMGQTGRYNLNSSGGSTDTMGTLWLRIS